MPVRRFRGLRPGGGGKWGAKLSALRMDKRHHRGPRKRGQIHQVVHAVCRGGRGLRQGQSRCAGGRAQASGRRPHRNEDVQVRYGSGPQPTAPVSGTEVTMSVCGRVAEIQSAMAKRSASRSRKPMTCKPMGSPSALNKGSDSAGLRKYELTTAKAALPVELRPRGAAPGAASAIAPSMLDASFSHCSPVDRALPAAAGSRQQSWIRHRAAGRGAIVNATPEWGGGTDLALPTGSLFSVVRKRRSGGKPVSSHTALTAYTFYFLFVLVMFEAIC